MRAVVGVNYAVHRPAAAAEAAAVASAVGARQRVNAEAVPVEIRLEDLGRAAGNLGHEERLGKSAKRPPDTVYSDATRDREQTRQTQHVRAIECRWSTEF